VCSSDLAARLRAVLQAFPDLFLLIDAEGRIKEHHGRSPDEFHIPLDSLEGRRLVEALPADVGPAFEENLRRLAACLIPLTFEYTVGEHTFEARLLPFQLGGALVCLRDISVRTRADLHLRRQAALLDMVREGIMIMDLEGHITYWNRGAEWIYGWRAAEIMRGDAASRLIPAEKREEFDAIRRSVLRREEWSGDQTHLHREGRPLLVDCRWTLLRNADGTPSSILCVNGDVTERRRTEAERHRDQRLESLGVLAGGIAHDLNNVLTPILVFFGMMKGHPLPEDLATSLGSMEALTKRGAEVVRQILLFAKGDKPGHLPLELPPLLRELQKVIASTFPKGIDVQLKVTDGLWPVSVDHTQIHQVMMNLCLNARDAMSDKGKLIMSAENVTLSDEEINRLRPGARAGRYVRVSIEDSGSGIPPEIIDRIFDPFFTTKQPGEGSGIGLSTVLGIVQSHDGFLQITSRVNQGTRCDVYFPPVDGVATVTPVMKAEAPPASEGTSIIVVDDERAVREMTCRFLRKRGYQTFTAENGAEALKVYTAHRDLNPLILLDMNMPVMNGPATVEALQKMDPGARVIANSGLPSQEGVMQDSNIVKAFLHKPYTPEKLDKVLREVCHNSK
jgi:PAS domain S-box-containing protein